MKVKDLKDILRGKLTVIMDQEIPNPYFDWRGEFEINAESLKFFGDDLLEAEIKYLNVADRKLIIKYNKKIEKIGKGE